jgi:hypothetical protein
MWQEWELSIPAGDSSFGQGEKEMTTGNNVLVSSASFKGFRTNDVQHICWLKQMSYNFIDIKGTKTRPLHS